MTWPGLLLAVRTWTDFARRGVILQLPVQPIAENEFSITLIWLRQIDDGGGDEASAEDKSFNFLLWLLDFTTLVIMF